MNNSSNSSLFRASAKAVLYVFLFLGMQVAATLVYMILAIMFGGDANELLKSGDTLIAISIFADVFCVAAVFFTEVLQQRDPIETLSIKKISLRLIVPIAICAVSFCALMLLALNMIPFPQSWVDSYNESSSSIVSGNALLAVIFTIIAAPIAEEVIFRAMVYGSLRGKMNKYLAASITSAVFGFMHESIIWFFYAALLGMIINVIFIRTDSIAAPILFHIIFNVIGTTCAGIVELCGGIKIALLCASFVITVASFVFILRLTKRRDVPNTND